MSDKLDPGDFYVWPVIDGARVERDRVEVVCGRRPEYAAKEACDGFMGHMLGNPDVDWRRCTPDEAMGSRVIVEVEDWQGTTTRFVVQMELVRHFTARAIEGGGR